MAFGADESHVVEDGVVCLYLTRQSIQPVSTALDLVAVACSIEDSKIGAGVATIESKFLEKDRFRRGAVLVAKKRE